MLKRTLKGVLLISSVLILCGSFRKLAGGFDMDNGKRSSVLAEDDSLALMSPPYLKTIVIDPGHGGRDGGAQGRYSSEKKIALAVSLELRDQLRKRLPGCKIVMTRTTDITQNVKTKADIANKAKGDLFISIHCNSSDPKAKNLPSGTETYIWGTDKNSNKELAMRENASLFQDKSLKAESENFKPHDPEKKIYYSLKTRKYFRRSYVLAETIEKEFEKVGRSSRQARQRTKGIWVLQATAMPSVLVETGFLSNPKDEKYLNSESGRNELAKCIANAVVAYDRALNKALGRAGASNTKQKKKSTSPSKTVTKKKD